MHSPSPVHLAHPRKAWEPGSFSPYSSVRACLGHRAEGFPSSALDSWWRSCEVGSSVSPLRTGRLRNGAAPPPAPQPHLSGGWPLGPGPASSSVPEPALSWPLSCCSLVPGPSCFSTLRSPALGKYLPAGPVGPCVTGISEPSEPGAGGQLVGSTRSMSLWPRPVTLFALCWAAPPPSCCRGGRPGDDRPLFTKQHPAPGQVLYIVDPGGCFQKPLCVCVS